MASLILRFTKERETQRKTVYGENDVNLPVIGMLYIDQNAVRQLGSPRRIRVTIEPDEINGTS